MDLRCGRTSGSKKSSLHEHLILHHIERLPQSETKRAEIINDYFNYQFTFTQ